ncbi:hypothetical protein INT47_005956 [Mucor saturninus]|uniref:Uncharacterized protein n=1 Tax=Mucor saturninus TaxID=64648 RepID=A0A8H7V0I4_9FUNG|nr:hypothetical protein INT47_005956 [Mucor saturninus]
MYLTQLTITHQSGDDITLFDILICCENIIELNYTSRGLVPFRANSQVGCTSNKHLKRLTISSQISPPAYIDYLRIIPALEYLNLTIIQVHDEDAFKLFSVIEPFADEFQKFKELRINFDGVKRLSIPPSLTNVFYSVLCKLKGDGNRLYDATLCTPSCATDNAIAIHDGKLSFKYISEHERLIGSHWIANIKKIVKGLTFTKDQFPYLEILDYAKEFPRLENLYLSTRLFDFRRIGSEIIISCSNPWGALLDQFHAYSPKAETITFDRNDIFCTRSTRTLTWDLTAYTSLKVFNFHVNPVKAIDYDFVFFKFEYDDFHCYKRIVFHKDKKNIPVTISSSLEGANYIRNVTIKLHSRSVKINCAPNNLFTLESVAYS